MSDQPYPMWTQFNRRVWEYVDASGTILGTVIVSRSKGGTERVQWALHRDWVHAQFAESLESAKRAVESALTILPGTVRQG